MSSQEEQWVHRWRPSPAQIWRCGLSACDCCGAQDCKPQSHFSRRPGEAGAALGPDSGFPLPQPAVQTLPGCLLGHKGASTVAQQVNCHSRHLHPRLEPQFWSQLLCSLLLLLRKQQRMVPGLEPLHSWGTPGGSPRLLVSAWSSPICSGHFGSDLAEGKSLFAFQINVFF